MPRASSVSATCPSTPMSSSATGWSRSSVFAGLGEDRRGVVQVGVDVVGDALGRAGEQDPGVREHQRVVVDVDDPRLRRQPLGHLVGVVGGRQAGARRRGTAARPASTTRYRTARARKWRHRARLVPLPGVDGEELVARLPVGLRSCPSRPASSSRCAPSAGPRRRCRAVPGRLPHRSPSVPPPSGPSVDGRFTLVLAARNAIRDSTVGRRAGILPTWPTHRWSRRVPL